MQNTSKQCLRNYVVCDNIRLPAQTTSENVHKQLQRRYSFRLEEIRRVLISQMGDSGLKSFCNENFQVSLYCMASVEHLY